MEQNILLSSLLAMQYTIFNDMPANKKRRRNICGTSQETEMGQDVLLQQYEILIPKL